MCRMEHTDEALARKLGAAVAAARKRRKWSQETLAERIGASKNHIGFIERGERLPSVPMLVTLAEALDLSLDAVLSGRRESRRPGTEIAALAASVPDELRGLAVDIVRLMAARPSKGR